ncbi:MAG: aminomethyl-transferring glycine dehydrogenase [Planctomycetes bacterium]|nr:aminomethyl-transferring glycine dehydrogenase [Planctomycetota bacterium]
MTIREAARAAGATTPMRENPAMQQDRFVDRHIGPREEDVRAMLAVVGHGSLGELVDAAVPRAIRMRAPLALPPALSERDALAEIRRIAGLNQVFRSYIGQGYHDCVTPPVILRNVLENPGWYTQYTPYQAEISQGRLEALLNFQTMVADLTGFDIANASMLDEGTAAAEAMALLHDVAKSKSAQAFFVDAACHPQTIEVVRQRALPLGFEIVVGDPLTFEFEPGRFFGALAQHPATDGVVRDLEGFAARAHAAGAHVVAACDPLSLVLLEPPAAWGADVAVGNTQRFGVPLGFGGPHAAFLATREAWKRSLPGRLVGVSVDKSGRRALRLALQTREQHIRREKATSNICTAQVLLAVMAASYAVYHGPDGLRRIATRVRHLAATLQEALRAAGAKVRPGLCFDTLRVDLSHSELRRALRAAETRRINLRAFEDGVGIALDETTTVRDVADLASVILNREVLPEDVEDLAARTSAPDLGRQARRTEILTHPIFRAHRSETEMMRYLHALQAKDLSLVHSMIPLGSCTMKLNAAAEMLPITEPGFGRIHPFAPDAQTRGYHKLFADLEAWLAEITGFHATSLQPNAGSQGEYAGLQVIRAYHQDRGAPQRDVCLIPHSAHGTNPASAVMAGMQVVVVDCDEQGNVDVADLARKAEAHAPRLAALMITYPSTHGVFEAGVAEICDLVHRHGGLVYMDGANMNAQVGLCRPGDFGADVCHLNLHKTFCIPHGGGGPGMGPICVAKHLAPYLPGHPSAAVGGQHAIGPISAAPWGSASILPISWMYIAMMGPDGLRRATEVAILNANYVAKRLESHYPILYRAPGGLVAHECILDCRPLKGAGVEVEDVAKRLMDFGFHAPTMSWPVAGTLMVEPTESESRAELDRFVEALVLIRAEASAIERGELDRTDNPLKNAPHTQEAVVADHWPHAYSRERAAFPAPWTRTAKFWPAVGRVDNAYGDRNLVCACPPLEAYAR